MKKKNAQRWADGTDSSRVTVDYNRGAKGHRGGRMTRYSFARGNRAVHAANTARAEDWWSLKRGQDYMKTANTSVFEETPANCASSSHASTTIIPSHYHTPIHREHFVLRHETRTILGSRYDDTWCRGLDLGGSSRFCHLLAAFFRQAVRCGGDWNVQVVNAQSRCLQVRGRCAVASRWNFC